jgi:hypothetical protein
LQLDAGDMFRARLILSILLVASLPTRDAAAVGNELKQRRRANRELLNMIARPHIYGTKIIDKLSRRFPRLVGANLAAPTYVHEMYTLRAHTRRVYHLTNVLTGDLLKPMSRRYGFDVVRAVRLATLLHDIGKAEAVESRIPGARSMAYAWLGKTLPAEKIMMIPIIFRTAKENQKQHTLPILSRVMYQLGCEPREIRLAKILVGENRVSKLIRGRLSAEDEAPRVRAAAAKLNMAPGDLFKLMVATQVADIASYPELRSWVVHKPGSPRNTLKPSRGASVDALSRMLE